MASNAPDEDDDLEMYTAQLSQVGITLYLSFILPIQWLETEVPLQ